MFGFSVGVLGVCFCFCMVFLGLLAGVLMVIYWSINRHLLGGRWSLCNWVGCAFCTTLALCNIVLDLILSFRFGMIWGLFDG